MSLSAVEMIQKSLKKFQEESESELIFSPKSSQSLADYRGNHTDLINEASDIASGLGKAIKSSMVGAIFPKQPEDLRSKS